MEHDTRFAILGPLRVWVGSRELAVSAVRERTLLAMLVVHADDLVPTEQLVDAIWGDQPPREARNQVQGCVSRLRRRLASAGAGGEVIRTGPEGYQVRVSPGEADVLEFRRLVGEARAAAASGDQVGGGAGPGVGGVFRG